MYLGYTPYIIRVMRILLTTFEYPPFMSGGIGSFSYELSLQLSAYGHEVIIITHNRHLEDRVEQLHNVTIYRLYSPQVPPKSTWYFITRSRDIMKTIEAVKPDIVHDISSCISFIPQISRKWPTVVTIHGSPAVEDVRLRYSSIEDKFRLLTFKLAFRLPAGIIRSVVRPHVKAYVFVSRFCLLDTLRKVKNHKYLRSLLTRSVVIYNGINVNKLRQLALSKSFDDKAIVFLGRLVEYKGPLHLLRAFKRALEEDRELMLHIIGGGPLYPRLREYVMKNDLSKNVKFWGALPRDQALRILGRSAILAHPSLYESLGMVILEAFALGKPVIVHKAPYAEEIVNMNNAGLLIDATNEKNFANALLLLTIDKSLYKKLSCNAEKAAFEKFDIRVTARKYELLYREALQS